MGKVSKIDKFLKETQLFAIEEFKNLLNSSSSF
jgi:hypothetical protein